MSNITNERVLELNTPDSPFDFEVSESGHVKVSWTHQEETQVLCDYPDEPIAESNYYWLKTCTPANDPETVQGTGNVAKWYGDALIGDTISDEDAQYMLEVLWPASFGPNHVQVGEPDDHRGKGGRPRFATAVRGLDGLWRYVGSRMKGDLPAVIDPAYKP